jgi:hypothetical protein
LRRVGPFKTIEAWGPNNKLGVPQLSIKSDHVNDFRKIYIIDQSKKPTGVEYYQMLREIFNDSARKQTIVIRESGRMNEREDAYVAGDRRTLSIIAFEKNFLYKEDTHFISGYPVSSTAFEKFVRTGEIGMSYQQHEQMAREKEMMREKVKAKSLTSPYSQPYKTMPEKARISNKQLREVQEIEFRLKMDPHSIITAAEKDLIERANLHNQHLDQQLQLHKEF